MTNMIFSKAKQQAVDLAKQVVKQGSDEVLQIPKETISQAVNATSLPAAPSENQTQGLITNQPAVNPEEVKNNDKRRLDYLEKELAQLRQKKQVEQRQAEEFKVREAQEKQQTQSALVEPGTKQKRGFTGKQPKRDQQRVEAVKPPSG